MNNTNKTESYELDFNYKNIFNFSVIFVYPFLKIFILDKNESYLDFIQYDILKNSLCAPTIKVEREFQKKIYELLPYIKNVLFISFIKDRGL